MRTETWEESIFADGGFRTVFKNNGKC